MNFDKQCDAHPLNAVLHEDYRKEIGKISYMTNKNRLDISFCSFKTSTLLTLTKHHHYTLCGKSEMAQKFRPSWT